MPRWENLKDYKNENWVKTKVATQNNMYDQTID